YEIGLTELVSYSRNSLKTLVSRQQVDRDRVFLLGHSEGAVIAMILAQQCNIAGIALMANDNDIA
ncbi:MAG: hypothetical protein WA667_08970, partial [Candidatus Nitrosopolaris sp.]